MTTAKQKELQDFVMKVMAASGNNFNEPSSSEPSSTEKDNFEPKIEEID